MDDDDDDDEKKKKKKKKKKEKERTFHQIQTSLQPPAHAGSSLADFSTLKMEAIHYTET
jgi:hypothetical protein